MLVRLLDYGRHLPVLSMVLLWVGPIAWTRLGRARRGFRDVLTEIHLRELAAGVRIPVGGILSIVDAALRSAYASSERPAESSDEFFEPWEEQEFTIGADSSSSSLVLQEHEEQLAWATESDACEAAFLALLRGLPVDEAQPMTGVNALMRSAEEGQLRLCRLLLSRKADANRITVGGATALSFALDGTCMHCVHWRRSRCTHIRPRPAIALLLLRHTQTGLRESFGMAVRMALQDIEYLPVVTAFVEELGISINAELFGPDNRHGTPLSVSLERQICPVEAPIVHRPRVVAKLLSMRADPTSSRSYSAWWGGSATDIVAFAKENRCDAETLHLLIRASGRADKRPGDDVLE